MATENVRDEFEASFDEAAGDAPAADNQEPAEGDGVKTEATTQESGQGDTGEKDGVAEDDTTAGDGESSEGAEGEAGGAEEAPEGSEGASGGSDSKTGSDGAGAAAAKVPEPDPQKELPKYDAETLRKAAELIRKSAQAQAGGQQAPVNQQAAHQAAGVGDQAVPQQSQQAAPAQDPAQQEPDVSKLTIDDYIPEDKKGIVDTYKKEWSEVYEAEQVIRDAHLQLMRDKLYSELRSALAPVFETTQRLTVTAHLDTIRRAHPDVDNIRDELMAWIGEQPDFVRPAYEQVAQSGTAEQVIELINQFKRAKGSTGAVPDVPASSASRQQQPAQRKAKPAAKKALAATPSPSAAQPPGSANPDGFDAAFEEAASGLGW